MRKQLLAAAASVGMVFLFGGQAQAAPSFCTGTIDTVSSGGSVTAAFFLTSGNCVLAGDKFFGAASISGAISGGGLREFYIPNDPGQCHLGVRRHGRPELDRFSGLYRRDRPSLGARLFDQ